MADLRRSVKNLAGSVENLKSQLVLLAALTSGEMKWKEMDGMPANAKNGYAGSSIFMGFILKT